MLNWTYLSYCNFCLFIALTTHVVFFYQQLKSHDFICKWKNVPKNPTKSKTKKYFEYISLNHLSAKNKKKKARKKVKKKHYGYQVLWNHLNQCGPFFKRTFKWDFIFKYSLIIFFLPKVNTSCGCWIYIFLCYYYNFFILLLLIYLLLPRTSLKNIQIIVSTLNQYSTVVKYSCRSNPIIL